MVIFRYSTGETGHLQYLALRSRVRSEELEDLGVRDCTATLSVEGPSISGSYSTVILEDCLREL